MYLTILDENNNPIMSAKLKHFSLHTSACESHMFRESSLERDIKISECPAVYNTYLSDIKINNEEALIKFEALHRLDHTEHFSGTKSQNDRHFYVFIQPKLRGKYGWNITETGYRNT